jgi:RNA polymerase sigma-70 factor, ECF subfamily
MSGNPGTLPTAELVDQASHGDQPAIDELLARHLAGLRAYVRLHLGPALRAREGASDVVQSVCREVLEHVDRFRYGGEAGFKHWLYATALRRILDKEDFHTAQRRDVRREARVDASGASALLAAWSLPTPSSLAQAREELQRLERTFDRLSESHREVIVLSRLIGFSHQEIAERLGTTEGAARVALHRALARLARLLEQDSESSA